MQIDIMSCTFTFTNARKHVWQESKKLQLYITYTIKEERAILNYFDNLMDWNLNFIYNTKPKGFYIFSKKVIWLKLKLIPS